MAALFMYLFQPITLPNKMKKLIFIFVLGCVYSFSFGSIQHEIDSIKLLVKTEKVDSIVIDFYINLSRKYVQKNNDSALVYAEKAYQLANRISAEKWKAVALCQMGLINFNLGNLTDAMELYNKSLFIAKATNYDNYITENYKLIGASYAYQKEYRIALNYNKKSLVILTAIKDTLNIARTYGNMAVYYRRLGIYDSSLYCLNIASAINSEIHNYRSLCFDYNNIGSIHLKNKEYKKAEEYYFKALTLRNTHGFTQDLLQSYNSLGNLFHQTKDFTRAIPYFNSCIAIAKELKIKRHMPLFYKNLSETYYELGNFKLALENKKFQQLFFDSINSTKTQILIASVELSLKMEEATFNSLKLEAQVKQAKEDIYQKSILIIILILITLIGFYIVVYSVNHFKFMQKVTKQEAELMQLENKQELLVEKQIAVQTINNAQQALTFDIAQLLNTEVVVKLKAIQLKLNDYMASNPEAESIINKEQYNINEAIHFIDILSQNLLPSRFEKEKLDVSIKHYLSNVFNTLDVNVNFNCLNIEQLNQLENELSHHIYRIIQELITNIIKHAKASVVSVHITNDINHILLRIHDDGEGFELNKTTMGIGIENAKNRTKLYNGTFFINTKKGEGTEVLVNLKFKKI